VHTEKSVLRLLAEAHLADRFQEGSGTMSPTAPANLDNHDIEAPSRDFHDGRLDLVRVTCGITCHRFSGSPTALLVRMVS